jgi:hypothetical protein
VNDTDAPTVNRFRDVFELLFKAADLGREHVIPLLDGGNDDKILAEINLFLLAAARIEDYQPDTWNDLESRAAFGVEHVAGGLRALAGILDPLPNRLAARRKVLIATGATDPNVPAVQEFAFGQMAVVSCPGRPDAAAGVYNSLPGTSTLRRFINPNDLPNVVPFGPVVVLSESRDKKPPFDLGDVLKLSREWRNELGRVRAVESEEAAFRDARQAEQDRQRRELEMSDVERLRRKVNELEQRLASRV